MKQMLLFVIVLLACISVAISDQTAARKSKEIKNTGEVVSVNADANEIVVKVIENEKSPEYAVLGHRGQ